MDPQRTSISRRELLRRGALGAAGLTLAPSAISAARGLGPAAPRVVIVGAGLAGLTCAYRLQQRGIACSLYEANPGRIGGRCWTARDFDGGQTAEHGGEFIGSRHTKLRRLAEGFGLELTDLYAVPNPGTSRIWLNHRLRSRATRSERRIFLRRLRRSARRVGPYSAAHHSRAAVEFDQLSVADWLDANVPGGSGGVWGQYVWAEMASEFGLDATELSALNLFYEYVEDAPGADERFHIKGGNDQVPRAMAEALAPGTVTMGAGLTALARRGGGYRLQFDGVSGDVVADQVVLAIPFTTLRRVDLSKAAISRRKRQCIEELGMGTNAKVLMQFGARPQDYGNWNGYMYSDDPFLLTWESTLGQPGERSIVTTYFGGRSGARGLAARGAHGPSTPKEVRANLRSLTEGGKTGLDGIEAGFNGRAWTDRWASDPWARGSYAAFLPGQYTKYYGYVGKPEGAIHFAGEHTATDNQGYLEGAVESGERCANEVLRAVGSTP